MVYSLEEVYTTIMVNGEKKKVQVYSEMHTGKWWWKEQSTLPRGATLVPVICMSDETHLSDFSGDKKAWPIYLTIGNILSKYRNKPSNHCVIILALLPIPPKRKNLTSKQQKSIDQILQQILKSILQPLNNVSQTGIILNCDDNHKRVCFPYLCSWVADHMKHI